MSGSSGLVADPSGVSVTAEALLGLRRHLRPDLGGAWRPDPRPAGFPGRRRGAGLEAVDVRVLVQGDDLRHLDRNVTARTGVPHVRSYREERGATALLLADFRKVMFWGTRRTLRSVAAAEALALAGWRAVEAGGRVGLYAFGMGEPLFVPPRSRMLGMTAVAGGLALAHSTALEAIASTNASGPDLASALEAGVRLAPTGATLVLATALDDEGSDFSALAGALARRGGLKVVLLRDAFETEPPPGHYPFVDRDQRQRWARVSRQDFDPDRHRHRLHHLQRLGVPVLPIAVQAHPEMMARDWDEFDGPTR